MANGISPDDIEWNDVTLTIVAIWYDIFEQTFGYPIMLYREHFLDYYCKSDYDYERRGV